MAKKRRKKVFDVAAKKKKRRKREDAGLWLVIKPDNKTAYLVARGIEQPSDIHKGKDDLVEVGPVQSVAFRVHPAETLQIGANLMMLGMTHAQGCDLCRETVLDFFDAMRELLEDEDDDYDDDDDHPHGA